MYLNDFFFLSFFLKKVLFILCKWVFYLHIYQHEPGTLRGQKGAPDPLGLELQTVVSSHVDAENPNPLEEQPWCLN